MGPHMTPEEDKVAELIYLELRAQGVSKTRAWSETGDLLHDRGHAPEGPRDRKTVEDSLIRSQRWREVTAAQMGAVCDVVLQQFEGVTHFGLFSGWTYSKVRVLAGRINARLSPGGLGIHIQSDDGGSHFGAFEYFAAPGTPFAPPPPPITHRNYLKKLRAAASSSSTTGPVMPPPRRAMAPLRSPTVRPK